MEYRSLGRTGIEVSAIGLGTMTFGEQNTEAEGHRQLDYAVEHGVNLIDTAEMYSVPPRAETYGSTERIIGSWLRKNGQRDKVIIATKVAGPGAVLGVKHVRGGDNQLDRENILAAVDALPDRQRQCLVLRYYAGLTDAEIAHATSLHIGSVKTHIRRGLEALRPTLEDLR